MYEYYYNKVASYLNKSICDYNLDQKEPPMKREYKEFFTKDNSLNKGYSAERNDYKEQAYAKLADSFPAHEVILKYEEAFPGSVEQILQMAAKEQDNHHNSIKYSAKLALIRSVLERMIAILALCVLGGFCIKLKNDQSISCIILALCMSWISYKYFANYKNFK